MHLTVWGIAFFDLAHHRIVSLEIDGEEVVLQLFTFDSSCMASSHDSN